MRYKVLWPDGDSEGGDPEYDVYLANAADDQYLSETVPDFTKVSDPVEMVVGEPHRTDGGSLLDVTDAPIVRELGFKVLSTRVIDKIVNTANAFSFKRHAVRLVDREGDAWSDDPDVFELFYVLERQDYLDQVNSTGITKRGTRIVHVETIVLQTVSNMKDVFRLTQGAPGIFVESAVQSAVESLSPAPKGIRFGDR